MLKMIVVVSSMMLSGCATITTGGTQTLTITTTPTGAACVVDRAGDRVGAIAVTPGSISIGKSKNDLSVTCSKDGFETATVTHPANFNGVTFGNIILGGVIGVIVDASSGASYYYTGDVRLALPAAKSVVPVTPAMMLAPTS